MLCCGCCCCCCCFFFLLDLVCRRNMMPGTYPCTLTGCGYVFWLSPAWLWVTQVDERHIPSFRIMHQGKEDVGEGAQEDHHYPFAGKENPKVCIMRAPMHQCLSRCEVFYLCTCLGLVSCCAV